MSITTKGYAIDYRYEGDGTLMIQVRIPSVHGPMDEREYRGASVHNYVSDENLPWYPSLLLPHLPTTGEVVLLMADSSMNANFLVLGLTGGSYYKSLVVDGS